MIAEKEMKALEEFYRMAKWYYDTGHRYESAIDSWSALTKEGQENYKMYENKIREIIKVIEDN